MPISNVDNTSGAGESIKDGFGKVNEAIDQLNNLGDLSTQDNIDNNDWNGDELSIPNGGTGASSESGARNNLGLGGNDDVEFGSITLKSNSADLIIQQADDKYSAQDGSCLLYTSDAADE